MTNALKRVISFVLSFALVFIFLFNVNLRADAATVDYVYAEGKFIKNWGIREQVATFLSPNADAFYLENQTSYDVLSSFTGSNDMDQVPTSELYIELQDLMESNQKFITDYGYTRYKFQYTDIQNSGKDSDKISSFYSGNDIGPEWDTGETWNREHTWPNSKGDKAGVGENDIMMLRPAAAAENGSRSNKAYGESAGYYNPNTESGGKHDLRGDVARIMLYQYVRWECTNTGSEYNPDGIFGTKGVIESREVLLEWIEADPVDTWELGRNDSVESITGTRNVFVDFPELSFILLGEQVPTNYQTPSGNALGNITPDECSHYYVSDCDVNCNLCDQARKVYASHIFVSGVCVACELQIESGIVGDVNHDSKINNRDYIIIMRYLNGWDVEVISNAADINNDGIVNGRDCAQLMQYINEWDIYFPNIGSSYYNDNTTSVPSTPTELKLVTDQEKILKDAFALEEGESLPYIAVLKGKIISVDSAWNDEYGQVSVTIKVGDKSIYCYKMKTDKSDIAVTDEITVMGVIKNYQGTVEFARDENSSIEVVLKELIKGEGVQTSKLSIVDNPVVDTAYKFAINQTGVGKVLYATGYMKGFYMATTEDSSAAVDVYLEETAGGFYIYAMVNGAKKYMNIQLSADGAHVNAVYRDTPDMVFVYDSAKKTMVTATTLKKSDKENTYGFGTYGSYTTIGTSATSYDDNFWCHFYK